MAGCRLRIAEAGYPIVHVLFKIGGGAECVYAHGAEEMAEAFAGHILGHGHIGREWWSPWAVAGATQHCGENIYNAAQRIAFMAAGFISATEGEHGAAFFQYMRICGRCPIFVLHPAGWGAFI